MIDGETTVLDADGNEIDRLNPYEGTLPAELRFRTANKGMEGLTLFQDVIGHAEPADQETAGPGEAESGGEGPGLPTPRGPDRPDPRRTGEAPQGSLNLRAGTR